MRRQSLVGFIVLNVIVTFVVTLGIIYGYTRLVPPPTPRQSPPLFVQITSTPDPKLTPIVYIVVTATLPGQPTLLPLNLTSNPTTAALAAIGTVPTLDPSLLPPVLPTQSGAATAGATNPPTAQSTDANGCQTYSVKAGDTPGGIATTFGVTLAELYKANKLKVDPVLQIGQVLVIPLNGCGLSTDTPTPTATTAMTATPLPTTTLAPTAAKTSVQITQVFKPGDITEEGVELLNVSGGIIPMKDWTLKNSKGDTFTFPNYSLFQNGLVLINTRAGTNTARALFWGRSLPLWGTPGETITLTDNKGRVQANFTIGGDNPVATPGS